MPEKEKVKVLFVCVKNASRSAMAEAVLKTCAKSGVKICSAGIKPGSQVNEVAVKVMREVGYDISRHEPKHISCFHDITFDYVAKMDVPDLGDMVQAKWIADWDIPDPAQGGVSEYRKVLEMICDKMREQVPRLLARDPRRKRKPKR